VKLTHELILQYRSPKGGWKKSQLAALGVSWPPKKGWTKEVVGMELTDQQFQQFTGKSSIGFDLFDANFL